MRLLLPALLLLAAAPTYAADIALPLPTAPLDPQPAPAQPAQPSVAPAQPAAAAPPAPAQSAAPAAPEPQVEPVNLAGATSVPHDVLVQFQARYLAVDFDGHPTRGKAHEALEEGAFFREAGRPDLADQLTDNQRTRKLIMGIAAGVAAVGVGAAVIEYQTRPDLNSQHCASSATVYNTECVPDADRHGAMAAGFLTGGIVIGAVLGIGAYRWDPTPVTPLEAKDLANAHNTLLWRTLRAQPVSVAPWVAPGSGGLVLARKF
ncbi:MAG: hypothetical protein JST54_28520 [Deltaproteobacteria bacterium]|nr:hypothetical protein [Deltaproteobacteria bacterium]